MQISPIDVDIEPFDILRENSPNSGQRLTFQRYVESSRAFDSASPYRLVFWLAESINFVLRSESLRARESTQLTRNWLSFSGCSTSTASTSRRLEFHRRTGSTCEYRAISLFALQQTDRAGGCSNRKIPAIRLFVRDFSVDTAAHSTRRLPWITREIASKSCF